MMKMAAAVAIILGFTSGCATRTGGGATVAAKIEAPAESDTGPVDPAKVDNLVESASAHFTNICGSMSSLQLDGATTSLYGKACRANDAGGCMKLAAAYMCGNGVVKNDATAISLFEKGCAADAKRCNTLGAALIEGRMTKRDLPRAFALYEKGCATGAPEVCSALGSLLLLSGKSSEHARAVVALDKACSAENGDADACANLGIAYLNAIGVAKDETKAAELGRRACEQKSMLGCTLYANALVSGSGAAQDLEGAAKLFAIACEGGSNMACVASGKCLYYGLGVTRDAEKASSVLVGACDGGNGEACRLLADWALAGRTAPPPSGAISPVMF